MSETVHSSLIDRRDFMKAALGVGAAVMLGPVFASISAAAVNEQSSPETFNSTPDWLQDFSRMPDGHLNPRYWNYVTGNTVPDYTGDAETYTSRPKNVRIENGALIIEAFKEDFDDRQYTSAEVTTQKKFDFLYGKLAIKMKLPQGVGSWPAAWLLPNNPKYNPSNYGLTGSNANWKINGEIDIAEAVGFMPGLVYTSAHTASNFNNPANRYDTLPDDTQDFHTFAVEKLPDSLIFTCDGKPHYIFDKRLGNAKDWPFGQRYYLIFDSAMGGLWGGKDKSKFPPFGIDNSKAPWKLEIESIAYYEPIRT